MKIVVLRFIVVALACCCAVVVVSNLRAQHASANQDKFAPLYSVLGMPQPAQTQAQQGLIIPVIITVYADRSFAFEMRARSPTPHCEPRAPIDSNSGPPYFGSIGYGYSSLTTFLHRTEQAQQASIFTR